MRPLRPGRLSPDHQEAVSRRLAQLTADLARSEGPRRDGDPEPVAAGGHDEHGGAAAGPADVVPWWSGHTVPARGAAPVASAAAQPVLEPRVEDVTRPAVVRSPGRHAARRSRVPLSESEAWAGARVWLGPSQVAVLAVLLAVGLAITTWWVLRAEPEEVVPVAATASSAPPLAPLASSAATDAGADAPGTTGTEEAAAGRVTVDVTGEVRSPGIAVLDPGARVVDALEAAGGARPGVDLAGLNLARVLVDGEQIVVGADAAPPAPPAVPTAPATGPGGPTVLVNLNTAAQVELETLPEVGPVTALAILAWRDANGGFTAVEELLEVDGIGDATLAQISPYVAV